MAQGAAPPKGIVLAAGAGTRLRPMTNALSKQLMPVYDKPLIYYPLWVLMLAGVREILIITHPRDETTFSDLLGDGSQWGVSFHYATQAEPRGIAEAYLIGESFVRGGRSALILGDNIYYGNNLGTHLNGALARSGGATIFAYHVSDPSRYGVISFKPDGSPESLEEKPSVPKSQFAVTGLYFYDQQVTEFAREIRPSGRGELEISDINRRYLEAGQLHVEIMGAGLAWLDTGTHASLLDAALFTKIMEDRQGLKICCPEEVAWRNGFIDEEQLVRLAEPLRRSGYGAYLLGLVRDARRR
jgi:glucose-1-phosphate thymidylyltransferase